MTDIDDAAAFEHYNDPANRDPGPGPPVRRRDSLQIREVKVTLPAVHGTAELTRGLDIAPALVVFNLRALDARSPNSEMPTRPASPSIPNRSPRAVRMAKRRARRRIAKTPPRAAAPRAEPGWPAKRAVTRQTPFVERLAYTRSQAAEALGLSRSTFTRRVLPHVATVEMPWGAKLIPVDELERLLAERRRAALPLPAPVGRGRPPLVPAEVIERIRTERAEGASLHRIAAGLNADRTPTAHGGAQWWPSTIRSALARSDPPASSPRPRQQAVRPPRT